MIVTNNYFDVRNTHLPRLSQLVRWCLMIMCKNDLKEINVSHRHHMFKKGYFYNVTVSSLIPIIKVQRTGRDDELKHQDFRGARTQCSEIGGKCAIQFRHYGLGHSLGEKITLHQMKNEKNNEVHICGFWYSKNMANFEVFLMNDLVEFVIKE